MRWEVELTGPRSVRWVTVEAQNIGAARMRARKHGQERVTYVRSLPEAPRTQGRSGRRARRCSRVVEGRLDKRGSRYSYPGRGSFMHHGAGPWVVELRDEAGRSFKWRTGMTYNQARAAKKAARVANYRDPRISKRS